MSPLSIAESFPLGIGNMAPHDALQLHKRKVVNSSSQSILINRNSQLIIRDLFKKLKRKELDVAKVPDITFIGEEGIDADGLTKEFFALVTRALSDGSGGYILFEGGQDHLVPIISEEFHQSSYFRYVGELIAMSVLHSGLGMVGVSRAVTNFMITDDMEMASCHLTVEDVPDYNIQQAITELQGAKDEQELETMAMRDDISLLLYQAGFGNQYVTMANKSKAIQCILFHQVFKARRDQIVDLMDGLNTLGILELLRANNACLSLVFPLHSEVSISERDVLAKVEYLQDQSERENEVALWFEQYVKYLAGGDDNTEVDGSVSEIGLKPKLEELIQFICGHPYLPGCGDSIKVRFTRGSLPDPESCFNTLKLPLTHSSYDAFQRAMNIAINCQHEGYGRG
ncbi:E3 ubiquitin-protein ligase UPL2-like isoform X1 [Acropora millepora]|nr:E3 ubiquitin-protein ligase UPL2-like isoform X1 [Acropora millepora]